MSREMVGFGDDVRIRHTPETEAAGYAGRVGKVYGFTQPSIVGEPVIGEVVDDFALNVFFAEQEEGAWFAPELLELADHGAGTGLRLDGDPRKWVRTATGEWEEVDLPPEPRSWKAKVRRFFG